MINRKKLFLFAVVIFLFQVANAGIMNKPRKIKVISTQYFDILFSDSSNEIALLLAEKADSMFEQAMEFLGTDQSFRLPVVLSPDSDSLKVTYSPIPYNRIVIYEAVPSKSQANSENVLFSEFFHQVMIAVNTSIRDPFVQGIHKIIKSDALQPVSLLNLPFSMIEGLANNNGFNDRYYLQLLAQSKLENEFPTWFQSCAVRDITPGTDLAIAAGSAFTAYIQNRWGFEKYVEFWNECTKIHFFTFPGIFRKIYGAGIEEVWEEFKNTIPLPDTLEKMLKIEKLGTEVLWNNHESKYDYLLNSEFGIIWYDNIRHEVDIYDPNSILNTRQLLFFADSIDRLSLSPDGRYLVVSYAEYYKRENFVLKEARVYDLKEREYITDSFFLRDAALIKTENGNFALAGINVRESYPVLQVYGFDERWNSNLEYERAYDYNTIPFSPCYAGNGKLNLILAQNNEWYLCQLNIADGEEQKWKFSDEVEDLKISELNYIKTVQEKNGRNSVPEELYTFQFVPKEGNAFTRFGYIEVNENYEPQKIRLQSVDFSGGVNYPVFKDNLVYFSSHKVYYDDFLALPMNCLELKNGLIKKSIEPTKYYVPFDADEKLQNFDVKKYSPLKYYFNGSFFPLVGIVSFDLENGIKRWPGLGFTYSSESDAFNNTEFSISGVYKFANLSFSSEKERTMDEILEAERKQNPEHRDFSFTGYVKNTSTPIDIVAAGVFDFDVQGQYDFSFLGGAGWNIPLGYSYQSLKFLVQSENKFSTKYYDPLHEDLFPDKCNWANIVDSYYTSNITANINYQNMNQYGISSFEKKGINLGTRIYAFWDNEKIKEIDAAEVETETEIKSFYQQQQSQDFFNRITQLNVGLNALVAIPRMTPLQMNYGWVLSVPGTLFLEIMGKNGTALETYGEMLLIGKEVQNGFPFAYLYFNRFGLKLGYNLALNYDVDITSIPDLRTVAHFYDIFAQTHPYDHIYLKFDLDFVSPVGKLSSIIFKSEFKASYYFKTQKPKFEINIDIQM